MSSHDQITHDPNVMGGQPCIRGTRVTVKAVVGLVAAGRSHAEILRLYPYLTEDDIRAALSCAAWRAQEMEAPLSEAKQQELRRRKARFAEHPETGRTLEEVKRRARGA